MRAERITPEAPAEAPTETLLRGMTPTEFIEKQYACGGPHILELVSIGSTTHLGWRFTFDLERFAVVYYGQLQVQYAPSAAALVKLQGPNLTEIAHLRAAVKSMALSLRDCFWRGYHYSHGALEVEPCNGGAVLKYRGRIIVRRKGDEADLLKVPREALATWAVNRLGTVRVEHLANGKTLVNGTHVGEWV